MIYTNTLYNGNLIVTSFGMGELEDIFEQGFKALDSMTWEPVTGLSNYELYKGFEEGEIDFIKEVK